MIRLGPRLILATVVAAQLMGTSLWFAGNAVLDNLIAQLDLDVSALGPITSSVQIGFIVGTLVYAIFMFADRFSPSKVFFLSAMLGAICNGLIVVLPESFTLILVARGLTGFFLAGIYPVGMKIAADHFPQGLGSALGLLLGALVLGTGFPHFARWLLSDLSWKFVIISTSVAAAFGGLLILMFVPDGLERKPANRLELTAFFKVFENKNVRGAAFGYFGHMWELYAFWAFVPVIISGIYPGISDSDLSLLSFAVIGAGAISCVIGGTLSLRKGSAWVAIAAMAISLTCCIISPLIFNIPSLLALLVVFVWGMSVIPDSPQFSALVAKYSAPELKGTALTIVNSTGFTISVLSIQALNWLVYQHGVEFALLMLVPGPAIGILSMRSLLRKG